MASYVAAYRIGMLVSTAGALFLVTGFEVCRAVDGSIGLDVRLRGDGGAGADRHRHGAVRATEPEQSAHR